MNTASEILIQIGIALVAILFVVLILIFVIYKVLDSRKKKKQEEEQYNLTFLQVKLPQDNEIEIKSAENLFSGLMGLTSNTKFFGYDDTRISLEIVSKPEGIGFYVVVPDDKALMVEKQVNGAYPEAEIDIIDPNEVWDRGAYTSVSELTLAGHHYFPIKVYEDIGTDALSIITSSMSKLGPNEVVALQYIIKPSPDKWRNIGRKYIYDVNNKAKDPNSSGHVDTSMIEGVEKKVAKPGFYTAIRIISIADDKSIADSHVNNVVTSFQQFTDANFNKFKVKKFNTQKLIDDFIYRRLNVKDIVIPIFERQLYTNTAILNTEELATIFHFPNNEIKTPNIIWLGAKKGAAPNNLPKEGLYLGTNKFRGTKTPVYLMSEDRRRHMYIIGQTGTGKSEFLKALALQDVIKGNGLALIDPHGSAVNDVLDRIPEERAEDVILFDASDSKMPLGLNILEAHSEEQKNMIINAFVALLYKLYDPNRTGIIGPQLERTVRNVMLTAMAIKGSTLVDVLRLLIDTEYSKKFLPKLEDPLVVRYWTDEIAQTSDYHKSEKMSYFVSKFDRFVVERVMRNILGQPKSALDFNKIMAEKKILLVDLSKGKIGEENSQFLGLILVPKILMAAMNRANLMGKEEFPDFYLYVDEFQNFTTPDFATILSEARKYKLDLTVANQFISQLSDEIRDAVFGNVGTLVSFRVGADDADYLQTHFEPVFTDNDLMNNPIGNSYARILVDGHPTVPFSLTVDWDKEANDVASTYGDFNVDAARSSRIRELSRQKYGTPVEQVEKFIADTAGFNDPPPKKPENLSKSRKLPF